MTDAPRAQGSAAAGRLRGKRVALTAVIALAVVFVGASAVQIIPAVFGAHIEPIPPAPAGSSARACAEGIRALLEGLDGETAGPQHLDADADAEWDRTALACAPTPGGLDAWAALMRLRSACEQVACRHGRVELVPLRQQVAEHLPADLR